LKKKALIFGITGQDGSYLAEILLDKGYEVHGVVRKSATGNLKNIQHLLDSPDRDFQIHSGDLADTSSVIRIVSNVQADEIYNEADQDHVRWSFDLVEYAVDITAGGVVRILEAIRLYSKQSKFFQPCSSNMFGICESDSQDEYTTLNPQSPYAIAKSTAFYFTRHYRETYGLFASCGILYNHESPRRTPDYVSRKITSSVAAILSGKKNELFLGDLSAKIDWGHAKDYMKAAWNILQLDSADDFVIGSGESHSVEDFVKEAFGLVGLDYKDYVRFDNNLVRVSRTSSLVGNVSKAKEIFEFKCTYSFNDLIQEMLINDIKLEGLDPKDHILK
jgi:GDPmannose 4,6-dehydratase